MSAALWAASSLCVGPLCECRRSALDSWLPNADLGLGRAGWAGSLVGSFAGWDVPSDTSRCDGDGALGRRQVRPDQLDWKFAVAVNNMLFRVSVWAPRGSFTCAGSTA